MKEVLLTTLRDTSTPLESFRKAADQLATLLAAESGQFFSNIKRPVASPIGHAVGVYRQQTPVLVPVLRSGLVLLSAFLHLYPDAPIGHIGIRRDEITATPHPYYSHLPVLKKEHLIFLLEPMIATGQTASSAVEILEKAGASASQIVLISLLAAPEGFSYFTKRFPKTRTHVVKLDERLDPKKWIVPGLGDFGDRYFGT